MSIMMPNAIKLNVTCASYKQHNRGGGAVKAATPFFLRLLKLCDGDPLRLIDGLDL